MVGYIILKPKLETRSRIRQRRFLLFDRNRNRSRIRQRRFLFFSLSNSRTVVKKQTDIFYFLWLTLGTYFAMRMSLYAAHKSPQNSYNFENMLKCFENMKNRKSKVLN